MLLTLRRVMPDWPQSPAGEANRAVKAPSIVAVATSSHRLGAAREDRPWRRGTLVGRPDMHDKALVRCDRLTAPPPPPVMRLSPGVLSFFLAAGRPGWRVFFLVFDLRFLCLQTRPTKRFPSSDRPAIPRRRSHFSNGRMTGMRHRDALGSVVVQSPGASPKCSWRPGVISV